MPRITDWTGITKTASGYLVRVEVRPFPMRAKRFKSTATQQQMQGWRSEVRRSLERIRPRKAQSGTLEADAERYLEQWATKDVHPQTVEQRTRHLKYWVEVFGTRLRISLTTAEIEAQLSRWKRTGLPLSTHATSRGRTRGALSDATVRKVRQALFQVYAVLDRGTGAVNPVADVPAGSDKDPDPRGLTPNTVKAILAKLPASKTKARCYVMAYTGLRPEEVQRIKPADIHQRALFVHSAKGGKGVMVPVTRRGAAALRYFVIRDAFGTFTSAPANRMLDAAARAAGFVELAEDLRVYDLRHSFGTWHYQASRDIHATQQAMRHASPRMTARYIRAAVSPALQASIEALDRAQYPRKAVRQTVRADQDC